MSKNPLPCYAKMIVLCLLNWKKWRKEIEQIQKDRIDKERKKWEKILNAVENGVETLFPPELLKE